MIPLPGTLLGKLAAAFATFAMLVGLVIGFVAWQRHDAAEDARNEVAVHAAQNQERVRREADAAAHAAERDDVRDRLRNGTFLLDPVPSRD